MWAAFAALRGACLGLAGRGNGRHSRPQAAFPAPRRARMRGEAALAPPVRAAVQIAGPRRGKAAGRRARPGLAAGSGEGRGPATPGGECVGRAARHGLRRRRGRAGKAGRSAADRAGGADGPTAPTPWGPGRPGAPTPQPARGWPGARPAKRPRRGLALRPDWVAPRNGWRLAWPEPPTGGDQPPHFPGQTCKGWTGRAAAPPPHRVGRVSARRPEGRVGRGPPAGGTRTGAPFPRPLDRQREQRRECPPGTPFYFG